MKNFSIVLVCLLCSLSALHAGGKQSAAGGTGPASSFGPAKGQEKYFPYWGTYNPPISLTQNFSVGELLVSQVPEGMSFEKNFWTDWVREMFGMQFSTAWIATTGDQNKQRLNLAMVNNSLPDIIDTSGDMLSALAAAGRIVPLDDLLEKYASPPLKYLIEEANRTTGGTFTVPFKSGGKLYGMPVLADIWAMTWRHNWIRQDYLDELKMPVPETIEQFEAVMTAYKAKHPNGIALTLSAGNQTSLGGMEPVMDAYGAYPGKWIDDGRGGITLGTIQPAVKQGLAKLAEWYKKGWLDQEFVVKNNGVANQRIINGDALLYNAAWHAVWSPMPDTMVNNPQARVLAMPSFKMAGGQRLQVLSAPFNVGSTCLAINARCKNPEAVIYLYNLEAERILRNNAEMRELIKTRYNWDLLPAYELQQPNNLSSITMATAAQYTYNYPKALNDTGVLNGYGNTFGMTINQGPTELLDQYLKIAAVDRGQLPASAMTQRDITEKDKYLLPQNRWPALMSSVELYQKTLNAKEFVIDAFSGAPTAGMIANNAYLDKLTMETFSRIIMGQDSPDAFDAFVQSWLNAGGRQIITEVNDWYKSMK